MRKSVVAAIAALSVAGSVLAPATVSAQKMTYAELYEHGPGVATDVGPNPSIGVFMSLRGEDFIESITEIKFGDAPYPGINIVLEPQEPSYPGALFSITATGGKIYPEYFEIPVTAKITYTDGSYEYHTDGFLVHPLDSLVADIPTDPIVTDPPPWFETVTETSIVTAPPETTTVTAEPIETTVTESPVTTTVTVPAEPIETTVTAPPVTTTVTAPAEPSDSSSVGGNSGGMIAFIIGILAALGIGAGGAFAAIQNGLI